MFLCICFLQSCTNKNEVVPEKYFPTVKKIIETQCFSCHNSKGDWQGRPFRLDNDSDIANSAEAIKASVADPVSITNKRMPLGGSLSKDEIDTILKWYKKGGKTTD